MSLSETAERGPFPEDRFADVLAANADYAEHFSHSGLTGRAAKGLAVVTCMDSRVSPLDIIGMQPGDVKILRNAGARVTEDVLRTLVLAVYLLGVDRVLVMPHTDCRMASADEATIHETIKERYGVDTRGIEIRTVEDQLSALTTDLQRIRSFPLLPRDITVGGAVYDVSSGKLRTVDAWRMVAAATGHVGSMSDNLKKGDDVTWSSHGNTVHGTVEKKITSDTEEAGRTVRASKDDPQYLVESDKTGKEAVHKPSALEKES